MPNTVTVHQGQCLADIAIQHCGDMTAIFEIAELNGLEITALVEPGSQLEVPDPYDPALVKYLAERNHIPATGDAVEAETVRPLTGIDYWAIEIDFEIQ